MRNLAAAAMFGAPVCRVAEWPKAAVNRDEALFMPSLSKMKKCI
jgi:hypothetical protein